MRGEVRTGRREAAGDHGAYAVSRGGIDYRFGAATRRAHPEHGVHVCDTGRVEAQRLIERRRALPKRGHMMRGELRAGRRGRRGVRCAGEGSVADLGYRVRAEYARSAR